MNTFIPQDPNAVILLDPQGNVIARANNIAPDFRIIVTRDRGEFELEAANKPFDTTKGELVQETLSSATSKARYAAKTS